jgi:hypothetical protein
MDNKIYKIGDKVWAAFAERRDIAETCPVCFGKLKVTLILGDDSVAELPCDYCGKGFDRPRGIVQEIRYVSGAELRTIDYVSVEFAVNEQRTVYRSGTRILYPEKIFDTEKEALECCEKIAESLNEEMKTRAEYIKADVKKNYSWNAGYHLREARRLDRLAAQHRERAVLCKAKSKEANANG